MCGNHSSRTIRVLSDISYLRHVKSLRLLTMIIIRATMRLRSVDKQMSTDMRLHIRQHMAWRRTGAVSAQWMSVSSSLVGSRDAAVGLICSGVPALHFIGEAAGDLSVPGEASDRRLGLVGELGTSCGRWLLLCSSISTANRSDGKKYTNLLGKLSSPKSKGSSKNIKKIANMKGTSTP